MEQAELPTRVRSGAKVGALVGAMFLALGILRMVVEIGLRILHGSTTREIIGPTTWAGALRTAGAGIGYVGSFVLAGALVGSLSPLLKRRWGRHFLCYLVVALASALISVTLDWFDHTPMTVGNTGWFVLFVTPIFGTVCVIQTRDWSTSGPE